MPLSNEQTRRVIAAIAECDAMIARETTRYSEANRDHALIAQTEAHKGKLLEMLN